MKHCVIQAEYHRILSKMCTGILVTNNKQEFNLIYMIHMYIIKVLPLR